MLNELWVVLVAVVFVSLNGLTMLAWAASQGYKMKPTAFAFLVGAVGNLITGSVTPISGQSSILTVSHFIKNINERVAALLLAVIVMIPLGLTGSVTMIADFAGPAVINGMMAGVGLMVTGIALDMFKNSREKEHIQSLAVADGIKRFYSIQAMRTGTISIVSGMATWVVFQGHPNALVYVIAISVTLSSLDYIFLQRDYTTGKYGRRVNIASLAKDSGYEGDIEQNENPRFWTTEFWEDFKLIKPKFGFNAVYFALAFISLNIGTNIAFGNITAGMAGYVQNMDHLTVINSLADVPSVILGGAPVGAIISATAASPWPVMAGVMMMLFCAVLLFLGLMTRATKYIPIQSIAGFLFIIGFFSTFIPNLRNAVMAGMDAYVTG
ncbi:MAG: hypothetical protein FWG63_02825, partial [Defluviitaleaceae bacterium]|nr:hypothetical protein [Defluviitaleaceae bacterium]